MSNIIRNNDKVTKYNNKVIKFTNHIYNVIVSPSQNGSVVATPVSGSFGNIVTLSNTPDTNYILDRYELTGSSLITSNTFPIKKQDVTVKGIFKLNILSQLDFLYQAKDLTSTGIPNKATNSTYGEYKKAGTLTSNGSGASCYLTNGSSDKNYLYIDLTTEQLNAMKATNTTYTFFCRVMQTANGIGGVFSWRKNKSDDYIYMIRAHNKQLQLHSTNGYDCGSNFSLTTDIVYKIVINGSSFIAYNLDNNTTYTLNYSTNRKMGTRMTSFFAGSDESILSRFYAVAGIARATTNEEDNDIKNIIMNQSA